MRETLHLSGIIVAETHDRAGRLMQRVEVRNLITAVGEQWYMERAAGVGSPGPVTGMKLGTSATTPTKTGAAAHIVTYLTGSNVALVASPASSVVDDARRITYSAFWAAGVATHAAITEVTLTVQSPLADNAGQAADTIARGLLVPPVAKASDQTLTVNWHHDLEAS